MQRCNLRSVRAGMQTSVYRGFISGNQLKIAACVLMLIDHIGMILFPDITALRIIGRLSMPLFAFTFAEGCFYTRNKLRHFLLILLIGLCSSAVMSFAYQRVYGNILITFALSSLIIYSIHYLKVCCFSKRRSGIALSAVALVASVALAVGVCCFSGADIDYGIAGVLLPVTVRLLDFRSYGAEGLLAEIYCAATVFLLFFIGLIVVSVTNGILQFFCLFSIIPLLFYSGKRGKYKLKYLFYTFYPLHLAILAAVFLILNPDYLNSIL